MDIVVFTAVIMALTQLLKITLSITSRYVPIVTLGLGVLFFTVAYFTGAVTLSYVEIINTLAAVLASMGLYSGTKAVTGN